MATKLHTTLAACVLAFAAAGLCAAPAANAAEPKAQKAVKAKAKAKKSPGKAGTTAAAAAAAAAAEAEPEPDITDTVTSEYSCELGNKVTIYRHETDDAHIALRWKKRLHRLQRVGTTTGALRFENIKFGLLWIGIPSKGMLLDSKLNRQLANECKNAEQAAPPVVATTEQVTPPAAVAPAQAAAPAVLTPEQATPPAALTPAEATAPAAVTPEPTVPPAAVTPEETKP
jgi:hypothetical protein